MELVFIGITAFATFFAGISAWMSYRVASKSLKFQKQLASNQSKMFQLNDIVTKLSHLKYLLNGNTTDDEFSSIDPLLKEAQKQIKQAGDILNFKLEEIEILSCENGGTATDEKLNKAIEFFQSEIVKLWS